MRYRIDLARVRRSVPRIARTQLRRAHAALATDTGSVDERVHAARTALKRTRALLRLVEAELPKRTVRRQVRRLRRIARDLSGARDAHVVVMTFDQLVAPLDESVREACRPFRAHLVRGRTKRGGVELAASVHHGARALARAMKRSKQLRVRHAKFRALARGLEAGYREARRAMNAAYGRGDDDAFHAFRKAVKAHGHHVRLVEDAWPDGLGTRLSGLAALDECLGRDHDLSVLRARVVEHDSLDEHVRAALLEAIGARQNELRAQARRLGGELFAWKARRFAKEVARRRRAGGERAGGERAGGERAGGERAGGERAGQTANAKANDVSRSAHGVGEERTVH